MAKVQLRPDELEMLKENRDNPNAYLDAMLRRFKKQVQLEGIIEECRKHEYFLKKSLKRKEKSKRAKIALIKANKLLGRRNSKQ